MIKQYCLGSLVSALLVLATPAFGQDSANCFLTDFAPKNAVVPSWEDGPPVTTPSALSVTFDAADTLNVVSKYIFGNAVAVWVGMNQNNPTLVNYLQKLSPTLIRYPGGSWSDIYFWNGNPGDLPTTIPNGQDNGNPTALNPQFGPGHSLTPDQYYAMRQQLGTQGLITVNYGYARYGQGVKPVERAAHLAADWVRYDNGRTRFWEIGNENAGPWEAGWQIDTTTNKDGQPKIINGELYGRHFRVFADSMRAAAAQVGATIFIGGQVIHYDGTTSWNVGDRGWNEGFFREAGSSVDFYVMHNYFSANQSSNVQTILNWGTDELTRNATFINQDVAAKGAPKRPIALTEYNLGSSDAIRDGSYVKGTQAVILFCEAAKLQFGLTSRWLVANWEADGMFYNGGSGSIPAWNPRPEFFYAYYTQRFVGDHMIRAAVPGSQTIIAYASTFATGHVGVIVVNKGKTSYTATLKPGNYAFGDRVYTYSLKGGTDNGDFSQNVIVNDESPVAPEWGPMGVLDSIKAYAYPADGNGVKFPLPARSAQFILLEPGSNVITSVTDKPAEKPVQFELCQNYPNPFNPVTTIKYTVGGAGSQGPGAREDGTRGGKDGTRDSGLGTRKTRLVVYDLLGRQVATLVDEEKKPGSYEVSFDGSRLASGVYIYRLTAGSFVQSRTMVLIK